MKREKVYSHGEYEVTKALPTGGKAGTGHNKTTSLQIWYKGSFVVKHISYKVNDAISYLKALEKAKKYTGEPQPPQFNKPLNKEK